MESNFVDGFDKMFYITHAGSPTPCHILISHFSTVCPDLLVGLKPSYMQ